LGESILRYKTILEPEIYVRWYHRLQRQADYLYKTITIDFANINYPACCAYAMALHWEMLKGLSGHGDYTELTEWLKHSNLRPHTPISLIHGEPDAADSFRLYLKDHTQFDVAVGEYRNVLTI
jgi:predicted metal-dependent RNase